MICQSINYEDETLINLYDLYDRFSGKKNYVCDGDSKKIKAELKYDFARVTFKKIPPKKSKSISNKKNSLKP